MISRRSAVSKTLFRGYSAFQVPSQVKKLIHEWEVFYPTMNKEGFSMHDDEIDRQRNMVHVGPTHDVVPQTEEWSFDPSKQNYHKHPAKNWAEKTGYIEDLKHESG